MTNSNSPYLRFLPGVILGAAIAFVVAGAFIKVFSKSPAPKSQILLKQGFDFQQIRAGNYSWKGPALGEKIELTMLKATDGSTLNAVVDKPLIMLFAVNPQCRVCTMAQDQMKFVRENLMPLNVDTYPICFDPVDGDEKIAKYAESLGFTERAFAWRGSTPPPASVLDMNVPSALLVDREGTIVQVWPGSHSESEVRQRMATQITADKSIKHLEP